MNPNEVRGQIAAAFPESPEAIHARQILADVDATLAKMEAAKQMRHKRIQLRRPTMTIEQALLLEEAEEAIICAQTAQYLLNNAQELIALRTFEVLVSTAGRAGLMCAAQLRAAGVTWTQIGDELGISRQAAQQRFSS